MKAEHRKELETNSLARQLTNFVRYSKKPPSTIWVLLGVVVLLAIAYWWLTGVMTNRAGSSWIALWNWRSVIEQAPKELSGTAADKAMQLLQADSLFNDASQSLMMSPEMAQEKYREASMKYEEVAKAASGQPFMALRALMGAARSAEAQGDLTRAKAFYETALKLAEAENWPDHPLAREARTRSQGIAAANGFMAAFYANWPNRLPKSKPTDVTAPPRPTEPDPITPTAPMGTSPDPVTSAPPIPPPSTAPEATAPMATQPKPADATKPDAPPSPTVSTPTPTPPAATSPVPTRPNPPM